MMDKQPGYVLYHVEQMQGYRQEMILEASFTIYINQEVDIEILDESVRMPIKRHDNILTGNIFMLLASP